MPSTMRPEQEEKGMAGHKGGGLSGRRKEELFHCLAIGRVRRQDSLQENLIFLVNVMDPSLAAKPSNVCIWG